MKTNSMMSIDDALDAKFNELVVSCMKSGAIDLNLYQEYDVKRGLRDSNGKGVLTGLTEISDVTGYRVVDGVKEPADGMLYYQGYDVKNLVGDGIEKRFAFEETTYLLLFGYLPNKEQLEVFHGIIASLQGHPIRQMECIVLHFLHILQRIHRSVRDRLCRFHKLRITHEITDH